MIISRLALALAAAFLAAAAFFPMLTLDRRKRAAVLTVLTTLILLTPLLIPGGARFVRFLAALIAVALSVKLYDLHLAMDQGPQPSWKVFVAFLPNLSALVLRKLDEEPQPGPRENLLRLTWGLAGLALGCAFLIILYRVDWHGRPFALEHSAKVMALYLALNPGSAALVSIWRLGGGRARDPMHAPALARTPADFWRRWNRPAQQFLYEDVFKPAGGRRSPIRAILFTFAVSALIHEYVADIAVGRVQGYQTIFFLLQGCAVAATARVTPKGRAPLAWIAGTLAFNMVTSVLFFASLNEFVPFYSRGALPSPAHLPHPRTPLTHTPTHPRTSLTRAIPHPTPTSALDSPTPTC